MLQKQTLETFFLFTKKGIFCLPPGKIGSRYRILKPRLKQKGGTRGLLGEPITDNISPIFLVKWPCKNSHTHPPNLRSFSIWNQYPLGNWNWKPQLLQFLTPPICAIPPLQNICQHSHVIMLLC